MAQPKPTNKTPKNCSADDYLHFESKRGRQQRVGLGWPGDSGEARIRRGGENFSSFTQVCKQAPPM